VSSTGSEPSAGESTEACRTVADVKERGYWDITIETPDYEPFWFADADGEFIGMDVDLMNEVNERLDIPETRYETSAWEGVLPATLSGASDFLPESTPITAEREASFAFGPVTGDVSHVIMVQAENTDIQEPDDLIDKTVGIVVASSAVPVVEEIQAEWAAAGKGDFAEVREYQAITDLFLDLGNGRIDAALQSGARVGAHMTANPGVFDVRGSIGEEILAAWVFRQEDMAPGCLGAELTALFCDFVEEGLIEELQTKWFARAMELPPDERC
jgi:ABC-type amino acid transport substrate-binding protein